jgi:hypothetical protein
MPLPSYVVELKFGASDWITVTQYVQSISINRGISRVLDDYSAGSISVTFVNNSRIFDPLNTSSPLWYGAGGYTLVQPAGQIRLTSNGYTRFTGYVQDWEFSFNESGFDGQATVTALDFLFEVSLIEFPGQDSDDYFDINWGIQPVVETTGDRIRRVFDSFSIFFNSPSLIDAGKTIVGANVNNAGENVLSYMQNLARSEPADFFSNASADIVMKDRSFVDYRWENTTRNNLIVYPGTATAIGTAQYLDVAGWLYGGLYASQTPVVSKRCNQATIDPNLLRYRMQYVDLHKQKYNPDQTSRDFTFSAYFRGPGLVTGGNGLTLDLELLDEYAQTLMSDTVNVNAVDALDWTQVVISNYYAGTGIVSGINVSVTAASSASTYFFIADGWFFERASSYTNYFDGTTNPETSSASTAYSVGWSGNAYESYSGLVKSVASAVDPAIIRSFADANSQSTFSGTAIPFTDLQVVYGSEQLYNEVQITGVNATAVIKNTVSQGLYGARSYVQTDNLTTSITKPKEIAKGLIGEFRLPEYRAEQMTIALEALTNAQQSLVLRIELRDVVRLAFKPSNSGSIVDKYYQVLGISSNTDVERDAITFTLASLDNLSFRLDSIILGILDTNTLG